MSADNLEQAYKTAAGIMGNVKADQLDDTTPCASWKVRELINHVVGGTNFFATIAEGGSLGGGETDFAAGDYNAALADGSKRALAAFRADGAMEKVMKPPFGEMPGAAFVNIAATDVFTHAWDLAKATGQPTDLDPELASGLLAGAKMFISDAFRGPEGAPFGALVDVPETAPAADQLAGFLGRAV